MRTFFCQASQKPTCVLLTRPLKDSLKLQICLQKQGIKSLISPVLNIVSRSLTPLETEIVNGSDVTGFILTSRHALPALILALEKEEGRAEQYQSSPRAPLYDDQSQGLKCRKKIPLFVVGSSTQQACIEAGFENITVADESAKSLVTLLEAALSLQTLLSLSSSSSSLHSVHHLVYLRGKEIRLDLMHALPQIKMTSIIAYEAEAATTLTEETILALTHEEITDVFFFSTRSAEIFRSLVRNLDLEGRLLSMRAHGISKAILEALKSTEWQGKSLISL